MAAKLSRIVLDYQSAYQDPLELRQGEVVLAGKQDREWPEFIWCRNRKGKGGWVPQSKLATQGKTAIVLTHYSARELDVTAGETVAMGEVTGGWCWVTRENGDQGWVPLKVMSCRERLIRPYVEEDWPQICAIWNRAKRDEFRGEIDLSQLIPLEDDQKMIALFDACRVIVAEQDGRPVGFAGMLGVLIAWLFVDPDYYRQGIGSGLLSEAIKVTGPGARLTVASINQPAISLYRKFGFRVTERFNGKYCGQSIKAARMSLNGSGMSQNGAGLPPGKP